MKRCVGSGREGARQVLVAERLFPGEAVVVHDCGGHPGDARLDPQGLQVTAEQREQLVAGGWQGRRNLQQREREGGSDGTHVMKSYIWSSGHLVIWPFECC